MINPSSSDIGKKVIYNKGKTSFKTGKAITGKIVDIDRQYVYVLYDGDSQPIAAKRKNLDWKNDIRS